VGGAKAFGKVVLCYMGAGAIYIVSVAPWQGHPHIPFSGFPGMLVWSPIAPVLLLDDLDKGGRGLLNVAIFVAALLLLLWMSFRRKKRAAT